MDIKIGTKVKPTCDIILHCVKYDVYDTHDNQSELVIIDEEDYIIILTSNYKEYDVPKSLFNKVFEIVRCPLPKIELNLSIICVESEYNIDQYEIYINDEVVDNFSIKHNTNVIGVRMLEWIEQVLGIECSYYDYLRVIDTYLERND